MQAPHEGIAEYDLVMEVDTDSLTEEAYRVGKFAGTVTLLVEAQVGGCLSHCWHSLT